MINIKELLEQFSQLSITEFQYKDKDVELKLKKELIAPAPIAVLAPSATNPAQNAAAQSMAIPPSPVPVEDSKHHIVKSPLVGTFYRSPAPGQKEFVQIGQRVNKGDVICIVEAMKVMNSIEADASGEIVEVLVETGASVEFGSALVKIRTV